MGFEARKPIFLKIKAVLQPKSNLRCVQYNYNVVKIQNLPNLFDRQKMEQNNAQKNNLNMNNSNSQNLKLKLNVRETAQYIADMMLELRNMAKFTELKTLQGLLEVSFYEAFSVANRVEIPEGEIEKLRELSMASNG